MLLDGVRLSAVHRYLTFLRLQSENPKVKLCPTYGIDIVWHAHMANDPHGYKRHTEALLGEHFAHDDSINDRAADAPLVALQAQTEALFAGAGLRFSEPGGMFRGTPTLLTASQRAQATGGARALPHLLAVRASRPRICGQRSAGKFQCTPYRNASIQT